MSAAFEADLCPTTGLPRVRFNFSNGWSASIVLHQISRNGCEAGMASLARCPTRRWGEGLTELGESEATADEAVSWLFETATMEAWS